MSEQRLAKLLEEEKLKMKHQFNDRKVLLEEKFKIEHDNQM